ncbi:hypothetical protein LINPERHAP1_LOCUS24032 [Linum perenne]
MEALRKQIQAKALEEELTMLREKLKQLETLKEVKAKEVRLSEANVVALWVWRAAVGGGFGEQRRGRWAAVASSGGRGGGWREKKEED